MSLALRVLSSMATRQVLAELLADYRQTHGVTVDLVSVGGVDAAARVRAGERFDLVILADDALSALVREGRLRADGVRAVVDSDVVGAIRRDATAPDVGTSDRWRAAVLAAERIGTSTGPSGQALLALFERWGVLETLAPRLVQARPGVPVGQLIVNGTVTLGFQQRSELMPFEDLQLLDLPPDIAIVTSFRGAVGLDGGDPDAAIDCLDFLTAARTAALKQRHGLRMPAVVPHSLESTRP